MDYEIPDWFTNLVSVININLSNKDKAHSIVLDNKAMSKLTDKDYDYIWHQTSILRLERLLKLQQQQLGEYITTKAPQYLIETINALEICVDYHKHPTDSKQQIAREAANTAADSAYSAFVVYSATNSAAGAAHSASWAEYSAYSAQLAARAVAYSAADAVVYSVAKSAWAAALAASWKQEAIDLSKILNQLKR